MRAQKIDFSHPDFITVRFSAVCAFGRSVRQNLKELFLATHARSRPGWKDIISRIDDLIDDFLSLSGASTNSEDQLTLLKSGLSGIPDTYAKINPALTDVFQMILDQVRPFSPGEIEDYLSKLFQDACSLAQKCIHEWGGPVAKAAMQFPRRAKLVFVTEGGGPTYAFCDKDLAGNHEVNLVVGNAEGLLRSVLSLEFYFFHEYLSHVFPQWDDLPGTFSEGFLFALGKTFFQQKCHVLKNGFSLHSQIVDADIAAHRRRTGKNPHGDFEGFYAWLIGQCQNKSFETLLLELAALPKEPDQIQGKYLALIGFICERQSEELAALLSKAAANPQSQYRIITRKVPGFSNV